MFTNKILKYKFVILIFLFALFLRVYKLGTVPPSLNWDEAANGYNAYSIARWGKDEWGKRFPLVFTSFRDDKHPVAIYATVPFVGIFGLNNFTARFPAAFYSSLAVVLMFFLAKKIFKSDLAGYFSSFFLAVSPYHIHYSRGLWEVDFTLFFFLLGLTAFFYGLGKHKLLYLAFLSFGLSLYSYHSAKIVVPPIVLLLVVLYFSKLKEKGIHLILSFSIFLIFIIGLIIEPRLLGVARIEQNKIAPELLESTWVYKKTGNSTLASFEVALKRYPDYFSYEYLFVRGDQSPRTSVKSFGEFYKVDIIFLAMGLLGLIFFRSRVWFIIFAWLLLAPFPGAISASAPSSNRAMFMMGSMHLISAYGASFIIDRLKNRTTKVFLILLVIALLIPEFVSFVRYYFVQYPKKEAIEWQYGMKEIVEYVDKHPEYKRVYVDNIRQQPYIFFLFYTEQNVNKFLETVKYDEGQDRSFNTVASYGRYQFSDWDWVNSHPTRDYLYIIEPSKYSGLSFKYEFEVVKLVKYPDGGDAFYLVTGD